MPVKFINITKKSFLNNGKPLFKIISSQWANNTLGVNHYLWFANPANWKDAFEKRFIDLSYKLKSNSMVSFPLKDKIFCSCFSNERVCEAQWFMYSRDNNDNDSLCLKINREKLLDELEQYCKANPDVELFIGKVKYQETSEITNSLPKNSFLNRGTKPFDIHNIQSQIRLLLLKRNAFFYEDEIRIFIINANNQGDGLKFQYKCDANVLVQQIMMNPTFTKQNALKVWLESPTNIQTPLGKGLGFNPITNSKCVTQKRVVLSHLYEHANPSYVKLY